MNSEQRHRFIKTLIDADHLYHDEGVFVELISFIPFTSSLGYNAYSIYKLKKLQIHKMLWIPAGFAFSLFTESRLSRKLSNKYQKYIENEGYQFFNNVKNGSKNLLVPNISAGAIEQLLSLIHI